MQFKLIEKKKFIRSFIEMNNGGNGARVIVEENKVPTSLSRLWWRSPCRFRLKKKRRII